LVFAVSANPDISRVDIVFSTGRPCRLGKYPGLSQEIGGAVFKFQLIIFEQLSTSACFDPAVDLYGTVLHEGFGFKTILDDIGQFEELTELDGIGIYLYYVHSRTAAKPGVAV